MSTTDKITLKLPFITIPNEPKSFKPKPGYVYNRSYTTNTRIICFCYPTLNISVNSNVYFGTLSMNPL